jgi:hypothetical protein
MTTTDDSGSDLDAIKSQVMTRLRAEGRWLQAMTDRDRLMKEARSIGLSKHEAQETTYRQLETLYPPLTQAEIEAAKAAIEAAQPAMEHETPMEERREEQVGGDAVSGEHHAEPVQSVDESQARARNQDAGVVGLDAIPADWPTLPANSSLAHEIQWVQANRLSVTRTADGLTIVDLSRALQPAPSWSALGWLETSIRAYSKFVDVAAKASASVEDEREMVRRERLAIDEIRGLLAEMRD